MTDPLRQQLRRDEGVVPHAYTDSLGYWTIGVGRLIDARKGGRLTDEEIDLLLAGDIRDKSAQLASALPWTAALDEARRGALLNMAFNLGVQGLLGFRQTLARMQAGEWDAAAREMLASRWAAQVGERAQRLARQIRTGEWQ